MGFVLREDDAAAASQLLTRRIGGTQNGGGRVEPSLVQTVVPITPSATLPDFTLNGVAADVFPVTRDVVTGEANLVRVVAPVENPNGAWSVPGVSASPDLVVLEQKKGTPTADALRELDLTDVEIVMKVRGYNTRYRARPFDPASGSILETEIRRDGRYIRQVRTLCTFVRTGVGTPSQPEESCLMVEVVRTTRSDWAAELIDIAICNSKWDPTEDQVSEGTAPDGPMHFDWIRVEGYTDTITPMHLQERDGQVNLGPDYANLASRIGTDAFHFFGPGSYFARRLVLFDAATVPASVARDIVDRRDFAWAEGAIGYCNGGWAGWATMPRFLDLPTITPGMQPYEALMAKGDQLEGAIRGYYQSGNVRGENVGKNAGWMKPFGPRGPNDAGEELLDLVSMEAPSPGMFARKLLECDGTIERHHCAVHNAAAGRRVTLSDYLTPSEQLPYGYSALDRPSFFIPAHLNHRAPGASPLNYQLAPNDRTWNELGAGESAPVRFVQDWAHRSGGPWGCVHFTHAGRMLGPWRAALYALDDPIAELAIRFHGTVAWLAWCNYGWDPSYYQWRWGERGQGNLHAIVNETLPTMTPGVGWWSAPYGGYRGGTPRGIAHGWSGVMALWLIASDAERTVLDGNGNSARAWPTMAAQVVDHCASGNGLLAISSPGVFPAVGELPNFTTRTGQIPNSAIPAHATTQQWTITHSFHMSYFSQAWTTFVQLLARNAPDLALIDRFSNCVDIVEDATEVIRPDQEMAWPPDLHGAVGTLGDDNPAMTEAAARAGDGVWMQSDPQGAQFAGRKHWWSLACHTMQYHARFGTWGGTLKMNKRQFAAPSTLTDGELLYHLWQALLSDPYGPGSGGFKFMALALIGQLQAEGVVYAEPAP